MIKTKISLQATLLLLILSLHPLAYSQGREALCPLPAAEAGTVIARWLMEDGFEVTKAVPDNGHIEINALKGNERWRIIIRPYSPLASYLSAGYTIDSRPDNDMIGQIQAVISSYTGDIIEEIPRPVLSQKEYVVCIKAGREDEHIQFSGFIAGKDGLIISSAHDLDTVQDVIITLADGNELKGRVIKLDFDRDLSLIDVDKKLDSAISLIKARILPETGEKVYSIGCTNDYQSKIHSGIINGPPGKVNNIPLWQVRMETLHGTSGGPVFDVQGNLVGIVKGRYRGTDSRGFLITVETLIEFLKD